MSVKDFGQNAARTDSFKLCPANIFVKGQLSKDWRTTNRYILKTRLFQPIKLIKLQNYQNTFLTKEDKGEARVDAKIFLGRREVYSFAFNQITGDFLQERKPPGLVLGWQGPNKRVLILQAEGELLKVIPISNWFKKPFENKCDVDLENSATVISFHGDVKLSKWVIRDRDLRLSPMGLKRGLILGPGNVLHIGDASSIKVKLDSAVLRTFTENTLVEFRRKTIVVGLTQAARIKLQNGAPLGSIGLYRSDGYHHVPPNEEVPLNLGDVIQTGPGGRGEIILANGQRIDIDSFTTVLVEHPHKASLLCSIMKESKAIYEEDEKGMF